MTLWWYLHSYCCICTVSEKMMKGKILKNLKHLGRQLMKMDNPDDFAGLVKKALE